MEQLKYKRMYLYLTKVCNTNCSYCYRTFMEKPTDIPTDMTYEVASGAIDFMYKTFPLEPHFGVNLWGGEPFIKWDVIKQLLEEYSQIGFSTSTNGILITKDIYNFLIKQHNLTITWSVGNTWEKYGSFEEKFKAEPWVYKLIKEQSKNRINYTVKERYGHVYEDYLELTKITSNVGVSLAQHVNHTQEHLDQFSEQYLKVLRCGVKTPAHKTNQWLEAFGTRVDIRPEFCATGLYKVFVDTAGNIWSCDGSFMNQKLKLGNITEGVDLSCLDFIRDWEQNRHKLLEYCEGCEIYGKCPENKCLNINYSATGDYLKPPKWWCDIQKTLYKTYDKYITEQRSKI